MSSCPSASMSSSSLNPRCPPAISHAASSSRPIRTASSVSVPRRQPHAVPPAPRPPSLTHCALQDTLKYELQREGAEVGTEHPDGKGGYIDLVACRDGALEFYEIKTDISPRLALRNTVGQLLEYAYWPKPVKPARLVVVEALPLDDETAGYLSNLTAETGLNVSYRQVTRAT